MSKTITRKYIQRITKREGNTSIRQSSGGGGGGGGASQYWVEENYISKLFFNKLFTVYDEDGNVVEPNDTESVIASIKSMFGFWTDAYLSALGNGEGGGAELTLASLADVDVHGVANGQALVYDATTQKWVPGQGGGIDITAMWAALAQSGVQQIDASHLATALTGYATETWVGNQGYITGSALNGYATESWVSSQISDMATQTWVSGNYLSQTNAAATYLTQTNAAATYLTKTDAATTYVSIAFFERLFKAYNGSTVIHPNNTTSTIDNIKAMFGFWTQQYISALGNGSGGSSGGGVTMSQVWSALGNATTEQINATHLSNALSEYNPTSNFKTINGNSIIGTGDIVVEGGGGTVTSIKVGTTSYSPTSGVVSLPAYPSTLDDIADGSTRKLANYLPLSGGTMTGTIFFRNMQNNKDAGIDCTLGTRHVVFGIGTSGNAGIWEANKGWIMGIDTSNNVFLNGNASSATKATQDGDGNTISSTYLKLSGGTLTGKLTITTSSYGQQLTIKRAASGNYDSIIRYENADGLLGYIGVTGTKKPYFAVDEDNNNLEWIWTSGNDGSGSGLDADLLDGQHGSYYAAASSLGNYLPLSGGTMAGAITVNGYTSFGVVGDNFYVGNPTYPVLFRGDGIRIDSSDLEIYRSGEGTPTIYFKRGTIADYYTDWRICNSGGIFYFASCENGNAFEDRAYITNAGYICASGFCKVNSSDSYVLLGGGGHAAIGGLSVAYATSATNATYAQYDSAGNQINTTYLPLSGGTMTGQIIWGSYTAFGVAANTFYLGSPDYPVLLRSNGLTISSNATVSNSLTVSGNSSIGGTLGVTGATTLSSTLSVTSNTTVGGTLGVTGATTLSSTLVVSGNAKFSGYTGFGYDADTNYRVKVKGVAYASTGVYSGGYVTALSDIRHKDVQGNVNLTVSEVANAPSVKFLWKDRRQEGMQVGSIAQYWKKVMPEAVVENADGELTMSYGVIALLASIATARKVEDHERRIAELERENKLLKEQLNAA